LPSRPGRGITTIANARFENHNAVFSQCNGVHVGLVNFMNQTQPRRFRARRLVVDTGPHSKGWIRQRAIDYGIGAQEVERYIAWPGKRRHQGGRF
jgi:hypothetical protein